MHLKNFPKRLDSKTSCLRITVPENLDLALEGLIRKVLREQPKTDHIHSFAADYFETLLKIRDKAGAKYTSSQLCPFHNDEDAHEMIKLANTFNKPPKKSRKESPQGKEKTVESGAGRRRTDRPKGKEGKQTTPDLIKRLPGNRAERKDKKGEGEKENDEEELLTGDPIKELVEKELEMEALAKRPKGVENTEEVEGDNGRCEAREERRRTDDAKESTEAEEGGEIVKILAAEETVMKDKQLADEMEAKKKEETAIDEKVTNDETVEDKPSPAEKDCEMSDKISPAEKETAVKKDDGDKPSTAREDRSGKTTDEANRELRNGDGATETTAEEATDEEKEDKNSPRQPVTGNDETEPQPEERLHSTKVDKAAEVQEKNETEINIEAEEEANVEETLKSGSASREDTSEQKINSENAGLQRKQSESTLEQKEQEPGVEQKTHELEVEQKQQVQEVEQRQPEATVKEKQQEQDVEQKAQEQDVEQKTQELEVEQKEQEPGMEQKQQGQEVEQKQPEATVKEKQQEQDVEQKEPEATVKEKQQEQDVEQKAQELEVEQKEQEPGMEQKQQGQEVEKKTRELEVEQKQQEQEVEQKQQEQEVEQKQQEQEVEQKQQEQEVEQKQQEQEVEENKQSEPELQQKRPEQGMEEKQSEIKRNSESERKNSENEENPRIGEKGSEKTETVKPEKKEGLETKKEVIASKENLTVLTAEAEEMPSKDELGSLKPKKDVEVNGLDQTGQQEKDDGSKPDATATEKLLKEAEDETIVREEPGKDEGDKSGEEEARDASPSTSDTRAVEKPEEREPQANTKPDIKEVQNKKQKDESHTTIDIQLGATEDEQRDDTKQQKATEDEQKDDTKQQKATEDAQKDDTKQQKATEDEQRDDTKQQEEELCTVVDSHHIIRIEEPEAAPDDSGVAPPSEEVHIKTIQTHYYDALQVPEIVTKELRVHNVGVPLSEDSAKMEENSNGPPEDSQMDGERSETPQQTVDSAEKRPDIVPLLVATPGQQELGFDTVRSDDLLDLMTPTSGYSLNLSELSWQTVSGLFLDSERLHSSQLSDELRYKAVIDKPEERDEIEEVFHRTVVPTLVGAVPMPPRDAEEIDKEESDSSLEEKKDKKKLGDVSNSRSFDSDTPFISVEVKTVIETQVLDDEDEEEGRPRVELTVQATVDVEDVGETTKTQQNLPEGEEKEMSEGEKGGSGESDSTTSSAATEIKRSDSGKRGAGGSGSLMQSQSLDLGGRNPLLRTRSLSTFRHGVTDFEVWSAIEKELEDAATKIQSKFRSYKARKKLQREDAVQITTEESSPSSTPAEADERQQSTGEFHDSIVLSDHPR